MWFKRYAKGGLRGNLRGILNRYLKGGLRGV